MLKKLLLIGFTTLACVAAAHATSALQLKAQTRTGESFPLERLKGKISVVFYWSTGCTVCRDSLPELRANMSGWRGKPIVLLTVNVDRKIEDWLSYERILSQTHPSNDGIASLRQMEGQPIPPKLPLTLLVDTQGKVVARFEGRLAPEVWDGVADLMP